MSTFNFEMKTNKTKQQQIHAVFCQSKIQNLQSNQSIVWKQHHYYQSEI